MSISLCIFTLQNKFSFFEEECREENSCLPASVFQTLQDSFLHIDIYKYEQVIRNLITNAVTKTIFILNKHYIHCAFHEGEVHPCGRFREN